MTVHQRLVSMPVCMFRARRHRHFVFVTVVLVVRVFVLVFELHMRMLVTVPLGEVQPYAECHQHGRK